MAYTSGIFYLDLVNGSDTARTALTGCIASNPSGTITRITKTAHGLVTGAVVDLTLFSAWLNGAFKITKVDNDNFDLDDTPWQATADADGTVTPRGGSSWTDAWRTINNGVTSARHQAGDTIRVAKSNDPVSIGNGTWTNLSATVTLATAQTANIYLDGAWTAANTATTTTSTTRKQGTNAASITTPAATATSTKYAYLNLGTTLDLSTYDAITFWFRTSSAVADANRYTIRLCSDTLGDTAVDTFAVPAIASVSRYTPLTLTRNGGGNLGNSIQSIALYTGTSSPGNSQTILIDNVSACSNTGLNLNTLIGQSSNGYSLTQPWHVVQSINGTSVVIDNLQSVNAGSSRGIFTTGTSPTTVTTYAMMPLLPTIAGSNGRGFYGAFQRTGTATSPITYSGGWNTTNNTQDGVTWVDGRNSGQSSTADGSLFNTASSRFEYYNLERFGASRMRSFWDISGLSSPAYLNQSTWAVMMSALDEFGAYHYFRTNLSGYSILGGGTVVRGIITDFTCYGNNGTLTVTDSSANYLGILPAVLTNVVSANNNGTGCNFGWGTITNGTFSNNTTGGLQLRGSYYLDTITANTNTGFGIINGSGATTPSEGNGVIYNLTTSGNTTAAIQASSPNITIFNASISEATVYSSYTNSLSENLVSINNLNSNTNDNRTYGRGYLMQSQTTVRKSATGIAWQTSVTNTAYGTSNPVKLKIAKIAVTGNKLVTIKAWVKLSHATDIGARLVIPGDQLAGVANDVTATKSADTNWEELTVTCTPTQQGVLEIELRSYWLANTADESTYVDDMTITEAS